MYYYFYKTTNTINDKVYYGVHQSKESIDPLYKGSGKLLKRAISKYGEENFKTEVLKYFVSFAEALDYEKQFLTEDLLNSQDCYNLNIGGKGGSRKGHMKNMSQYHLSKPQHVKEKISNSLLGKCFLTEQGRKLKSDKMKNNEHALGMSYNHTDEAKAAIARSRLGKTNSETTKQKISSNRKNKCLGVNNAMSTEENRNKVRKSKVGNKKLIKDDKFKWAKPGTEKWINLINEGYVCLAPG